MTSKSQLDQAIAHFEQAMRQLEAAWAQAEKNQGQITKMLAGLLLISFGAFFTHTLAYGWAAF